MPGPARQFKNVITLGGDALGRRVIPGLNDSHLHVIRGGNSYLLELRWDGVPSLALALAMLREQAGRTPKGQWVRVVGGWTADQFAEKRLPTLKELNAVAPDTPVFVLHLYHSALLNKAALPAVCHVLASQFLRSCASASGTGGGLPGAGCWRASSCWHDFELIWRATMMAARAARPAAMRKASR